MQTGVCFDVDEEEEEGNGGKVMRTGCWAATCCGRGGGCRSSEADRRASERFPASYTCCSSTGTSKAGRSGACNCMRCSERTERSHRCADEPTNWPGGSCSRGGFAGGLMQLAHAIVGSALASAPKTSTSSGCAWNAPPCRNQSRTRNTSAG